MRIALLVPAIKMWLHVESLLVPVLWRARNLVPPISGLLECSESRPWPVESRATSFREWLESSCEEDAAYTTLRTSQRRVLGFSFHVDRLEQAARELFDVDVLLGSRMRRALSQLCVHDSQVCLALRRTGTDLELCAVGRPAPPLRTDAPAALHAALVRGKRVKPHIKRSSWCKARRAFEAHDYEHTILYWHNHVLEGLTTNVAIITGDSRLLVPTDDVLPGFAISLAVRAAADLGLSVDRNPVPLPRQLGGPSHDDWNEVILTNANVLCAPVASLTRLDTRRVLNLEQPEFPRASALRTAMLHILQADPSWSQPIDNDGEDAERQ